MEGKKAKFYNPKTKTWQTTIKVFKDGEWKQVEMQMVNGVLKIIE